MESMPCGEKKVKNESNFIRIEPEPNLVRCALSQLHRKMPTIGRSPKVSARSAAAVRVALSKNLEKRKRSEKPRNLEIAES